MNSWVSCFCVSIPQDAPYIPFQVVCNRTIWVPVFLRYRCPTVPQAYCAPDRALLPLIYSTKCPTTGCPKTGFPGHDDRPQCFAPVPRNSYNRPAWLDAWSPTLLSHTVYNQEELRLVRRHFASPDTLAASDRFYRD